MDNNSIGTTGIDSLPTAGGGGNNEDNVQLTTKELSSNTVVENPTEKLQEQRQLDQNEFVKSLQQAAASGSTALPSRDIPIDKANIVQDKQTKPNFVPEGPSDYITEHQTSDEIIRQNAKVQQQQDRDRRWRPTCAGGSCRAARCRRRLTAQGWHSWRHRSR